MSSIRPANERSSVSRNGRGLDVLLDSDTTGGALAVIDVHIPAGSPGPPLHTHPGSDETFVVLSGALLVHLAGSTERIEPGGMVHISRGASHTFATPPDDGAHFLTIHTPGGFENFHVSASQLEQTRGGPLSPQELIEVAKGFDWALAGPPLLPNGHLAQPPVG